MTSAEIWIHFAAAALARSPETSPADAASFADKLMLEFLKRHTVVMGAWERKIE